MKKKEVLPCFIFLLVLLGGCLMSGCGVGVGAGKERVRMRVSPYFGSSFRYLDLEKLGEYKPNRGKVGMFYTCKAGYIDTGHLFESIDVTNYVFSILSKNMENGNKEFSFKLIGPAKYIVQVKYPNNWDSLNEIEKERVVREHSIDLAQYIAYSSTVWHEIITWYGYSSVVLFSEKTSSFSWEDLYSDLLGTKICGQALKQGGDFNQAITMILNKELEQLDVQPSYIAKKATSKIRGKWFFGITYPIIVMNKRNFDTGLDKGYLTPWLVPGICGTNIPQSCSVLDLNSISRNGFSFVVELEPKCSSGKRAAKIVNKKRLQVSLDFPKITEYLRRKATKKNSKLDKPSL